jgi:tripartite-type tricarboxylate transporter receptor subunit TctC
VSPGFDAVAWNALFAPPGTPQPILAKLNEVVRKTFEAPEMRARFEQLGQEVAIGSPAELTQFIQDDIARWKGVAATNKLSF